VEAAVVKFQKQESLSTLCEYPVKAGFGDIRV
jgi:hypothetical protein